MKRTQTILGAVLLLQVVLILLVRSPFSSGGGASEARLLLPVLEAITPARVEIRGAEDDVVTLARQGSSWTVEEAGGYPADAAKVEKLIDDLQGLKVRRPVVSGSRYHGALEVSEDKAKARLRVWDESSDDPKAELILGSSPGYRRTHARLAGEDPVYEIGGIAPYDLRAESGNWVDRKLVDLTADRVVGVALTNGEGSFELAREGEDWLILAGLDESRELNEEELDTFLRAATSISLADPVGPVDLEAQGLAEPSARLILKLAAADPAGEGEDAEASPPEEIVVLVGATVPDQDNHRYVTKEGFGFAVTVWESSVKQLLEKKLEDLLAS
jgi:hypothetical protein